MNRAPATTDNVQQHVTESIQSLLSAMRALAQPAASVNTDALKREVLEDFAKQVAGPLKTRVCEELRKEFSGVSSSGGKGGGAAVSAEEIVKICVQHAEQLFVSPSWQKAVQSIIQDALQNVLPGLIKRLREDIDKRLGEGGGAESGGGAGISKVVNSAEMKEMIEERFRMMLLYLKQEVIPKAVQAAHS
ncbi:MAG: hypothetical protein ACKVX7_02275 [Planctomycetota bacterium]